MINADGIIIFNGMKPAAKVEGRKERGQGKALVNS